MIHIKIEKEEIKKIQKRWSKWFFREKQIEEFIEIMDSDDSFRKMIFKNGKEYLLWKNEFIQNREVIKNTSWKRYIIDYFFRNLSKEDEVIRIYKKDIKKTTREYLIRKYENYRKSVAFIDIVKILNVQVCPYCNRNFLESYTIVDEYGKKKRMFKGDIDHYYSKNEIPALALSFYNLVPCCKICNHEKLNFTKRTFNPYYDYENKEYKFCIELYTNSDERDINNEKILMMLKTEDMIQQFGKEFQTTLK